MRTRIKQWFGQAVLALAALTALPAAQAQTVEYIHTDALGSVVAVTDQNRQVLERREYEPYGDQISPAAKKDGPNYTGHVLDSSTGLIYAQQRYYDQSVGRFLSVDPVVADGGTGGNFNRYWYANNNPYKFKDPDGRIIDTIADIGFIGYDIYTLIKEPSWTNAGALGADVVGAVVPLATGLGTAVRGTVHGAEALRTADKAADAAKSADKLVSGAKGGGRSGKQARLRELADDPKVSSADRGWLKNEKRQIEQGNRKTLRNPPGKDLAHERGREAAKGYGYEHSNLQDRDLHKLQHKFDDFGRANKERPVKVDE